MGQREDLQELKDLEELERLEAEEAQASPTAPPAVPYSAPSDGSTNTPTSLPRAAEFASRGFADTAMEYAGLPGEAVYAAGRALGVTDKPYGTAQKYLKEGARDIGRFVSAPINAVTDFGPDAPQSTLERGAYGSGRGLADALTMMAPGGVAAKYAKAGSTLSNVGKALKAQPVLQGVSGAVGSATTEMTDSQWAGLGASLGVPVGTAMTAAAFRKLITPFASQLSNNAKSMAEAAEKMGIKLTVGQKSGSPSLQTMESSFTQLPFTSNSQKSIYDAQRKAFNRHVLSKAGIDADEASPEVLNKAFKSIGKEFDDLAARTTIKIDDKFFSDVETKALNYSRRLSRDVKSSFKSYVDDIMEMKKYDKPEISGTTYQDISSDLKKAARSSANDPKLQDALNGLAKFLDDTLDRSGGSNLKAAWKDVRRRYNHLDTINKSMKGGTTASRTDADIPFAGLKTEVAKKDQRGFGQGRGDLNKSARVGDFLAQSIPPDSGTARRNKMVALLTGEFGGGMGMAAGADPAVMLPMMAAPFVVPKTTQAIYQSPIMQKYLRNQAIQPGPRKLTAELLSKILAAQTLGDQTEGTR